MQEPRRITMVEKRQLVDRVVNLVRGAQELFPESVLVYMTMFPRHVERCCDKDGHMRTSDVIGLDSVRRDVDRDVIEMFQDTDQDVKVIHWWDVLGLEQDKTVGEVRALKVIEGDGVHLTTRANRNAAVLLCRRIREMVLRASREMEIDEEDDGAGKRMKRE
jgi:hypothetical protein